MVDWSILLGYSMNWIILRKSDLEGSLTKLIYLEEADLLHSTHRQYSILCALSIWPISPNVPVIFLKTWKFLSGVLYKYKLFLPTFSFTSD